jgi:hypothetical protein
MKKILIFMMLVILCSCGSEPIRTTEVVVNITGVSSVKITSDTYDENINVSGFYSNSFTVPVGSKFNLKWTSNSDVTVQIICDDKIVREGKEKNGEIIYEVDPGVVDCFINSLRRKK